MEDNYEVGEEESEASGDAMAKRGIFSSLLYAKDLQTFFFMKSKSTLNYRSDFSLFKVICRNIIAVILKV